MEVNESLLHNPRENERAKTVIENLLSERLWVCVWEEEDGRRIFTIYIYLYIPLGGI